MMRTVVIGGTSGIGLEVARTRAARGDEVVLTGRDRERAAEVARSVEGDVAGLAVDLNDTHGLADSLAGIGTVDRLVIAAIERALEAAGIEFIPENGGGPGVRLKAKRQ